MTTSQDHARLFSSRRNAIIQAAHPFDDKPSIFVIKGASISLIVPISRSRASLPPSSRSSRQLPLSPRERHRRGTGGMVARGPNPTRSQSKISHLTPPSRLLCLGSRSQGGIGEIRQRWFAPQWLAGEREALDRYDPLQSTKSGNPRRCVSAVCKSRLLSAFAPRIGSHAHCRFHH